jgi:hypothetical protein
MRAILFASATTVTLRCFRSDSSVSHFPRAEGFRSICITTDRAPWSSIRRRYSLPRLLMPSSFVLATVECCRGTRPNHAARSRPFRKVIALPTEATSAVETSGPKPGISVRRWQASSCLATRWSSALASSMRFSNSSHSCFSSSSKPRRRAENALHFSKGSSSRQRHTHSRK